MTFHIDNHGGGLQQPPPLRNICSGKMLRRTRVNTKRSPWEYSGTFQFLDLQSRNQILSNSIMTSSFVWKQILLLCLFHQVLVSLEQSFISFGSNISPAISFHRVFMVYCCFYRQLTSENLRVRELSPLRKSTKKTEPVSSLKISISIVVYKDSEGQVLMCLALGPPGMKPQVTLIVVILVYYF